MRRQSEHRADYEAALDRLRAMGLLYRCFRTRKDMAQAITSAPHGRETVWRGGALTEAEEAERLARGEPFAWRLSVERARKALGEQAWSALAYIDLDEGVRIAHPDAAGDVVLARKDIGVAYHLACVLDDAVQDVTHVIRGEDLRDAVHVQRLLHALLDLPTPAYRHHPLLVGADGERLAKRAGSPSLRGLRVKGASPRDVWAMAGFDAAPADSR